MLAATAIGVGGVQARAQGRPGFHHAALLEGVSLTDAQQTQVHALHKAAWQDEKTLRQQLHAVQEQIDSTLLSSGSVTQADLATLAQQRESVMQQLDARRLTEQLAIRNLLTADQIAQAASTHAKLAALRSQEMALHDQGAPAAGVD